MKNYSSKQIIQQGYYFKTHHPFSMDYMVSNALMEKEISRMASVLGTITGSGSSNIKNIFADRQSQIQIKMNMLVLQVESGQLTMPMYMEQVKKAIAFERNRALTFKRAGQMDHAKYCLWRMKVMTEEVKEVEENQ